MTSNLEIPASYAGGASLRADCQTASVRHSGWMLELERALLELNAAKRPSEAECGGANERCDVGGRCNPDDVRNASLSPNAETGRTPALSSSAQHDAGNARRTTDGTRDELTSHRVGNDARASLSDLGTGRSQGTFGTDAMSQVSEMPLLGEAGGVHRAAQGGIAAEAKNTQQPNAIAKPASHIGAALPGERTPPPADTGTAADSQDTSGAGDADQTRRPIDLPHADQPYALRQLHLYHAKDGVHAWIRDADLAEFQVHAIAAAVHGELNGAGLKLTALTLNGKKIANLYLAHQLVEHDQTPRHNRKGAL